MSITIGGSNSQTGNSSQSTQDVNIGFNNTVNIDNNASSTTSFRIGADTGNITAEANTSLGDVSSGNVVLAMASHTTANNGTSTTTITGNGDGDISIDVRNSNTGSGSTSTFNQNINSSSSFNSTSNATSNTSVNANLSTGGFHISGNTTTGGIHTGSINVSVTNDTNLNGTPTPTPNPTPVPTPTPSTPSTSVTTPFGIGGDFLPLPLPQEQRVLAAVPSSQTYFAAGNAALLPQMLIFAAMSFILVFAYPPIKKFLTEYLTRKPFQEEHE